MLKEPSKISKMYTVESTRNRSLSRYKDLRRLVNENKQSYIESSNKFKIKESTEDIFYTVEPGYENRLDLISYEFYNTPFLWWAIAIMNGIENPIEDVKSGIVLRIPDRQNIIL